MERRVISTEFTDEDMKIESGLRPEHLRDYIGQDKDLKHLGKYLRKSKEKFKSVY